MIGPFPLAAGLAIGAAIGYGRIRRTFPITDLPMRLRVKAALTMPPMSDRIAMAAASIGGQAVVSNVNIRGQVEVPAGHATFRNVLFDNSEVEQLRAEVRRLNRLSTVQGAHESRRHWKGIARSERARRKEAEAELAAVRAATARELETGRVMRDASGNPRSITLGGFDPSSRCRAAGGHAWANGSEPNTWRCTRCPVTIAAAESGPDTNGTDDA